MSWYCEKAIIISNRIFEDNEEEDSVFEFDSHSTQNTMDLGMASTMDSGDILLDDGDDNYDPTDSLKDALAEAEAKMDALLSSFDVEGLATLGVASSKLESLLAQDDDDELCLHTQSSAVMTWDDNDGIDDILNTDDEDLKVSPTKKVDFFETVNSPDEDASASNPAYDFNTFTAAKKKALSPYLVDKEEPDDELSRDDPEQNAKVNITLDMDVAADPDEYKPLYQEKPHDSNGVEFKEGYRNRTENLALKDTRVTMRENSPELEEESPEMNAGENLNDDDEDSFLPVSEYQTPLDDTLPELPPEFLLQTHTSNTQEISADINVIDDEDSDEVLSFLPNTGRDSFAPEELTKLSFSGVASDSNNAKTTAVTPISKRTRSSLGGIGSAQRILHEKGRIKGTPRTPGSKMASDLAAAKPPTNFNPGDTSSALVRAKARAAVAARNKPSFPPPTKVSAPSFSSKPTPSGRSTPSSVGGSSTATPKTGVSASASKLSQRKVVNEPKKHSSNQIEETRAKVSPRSASVATAFPKKSAPSRTSTTFTRPGRTFSSNNPEPHSKKQSSNAAKTVSSSTLADSSGKAVLAQSTSGASETKTRETLAKPANYVTVDESETNPNESQTKVAITLTVTVSESKGNESQTKPTNHHTVTFSETTAIATQTKPAPSALVSETTAIEPCNKLVKTTKAVMPPIEAALTPASTDTASKVREPHFEPATIQPPTFFQTSAVPPPKQVSTDTVTAPEFKAIDQLTKTSSVYNGNVLENKVSEAQTKLSCAPTVSVSETKMVITQTKPANTHTGTAAQNKAALPKSKPPNISTANGPGVKEIETQRKPAATPTKLPDSEHEKSNPVSPWGNAASPHASESVAKARERVRNQMKLKQMKILEQSLSKDNEKVKANSAEKNQASSKMSTVRSRTSTLFKSTAAASAKLSLTARRPIAAVSPSSSRSTTSRLPTSQPNSSTLAASSRSIRSTLTKKKSSTVTSRKLPSFTSMSSDPRKKINNTTQALKRPANNNEAAKKNLERVRTTGNRTGTTVCGEKEKPLTVSIEAQKPKETPISAASLVSANGSIVNNFVNESTDNERTLPDKEHLANTVTEVEKPAASNPEVDKTVPRKETRMRMPPLDTAKDCEPTEDSNMKSFSRAPPQSPSPSTYFKSTPSSKTSLSPRAYLRPTSSSKASAFNSDQNVKHDLASSTPRSVTKDIRASISKRRAEAMLKHKERAKQALERRMKGRRSELPLPPPAASKAHVVHFSPNSTLTKPTSSTLCRLKAKEEEMHTEPPTVNHAKPHATIPQTPRLSTMERHGEKHYSVASGSHPSSPVRSLASASASAKVDIKELSLAECVGDFFAKSLREDSAPNSPVKSTGPRELTIPHTPNVLKHQFKKTPKGGLVKSREEMVDAEVEYCKTHQFKARPVPDLLKQAPLPPKAASAVKKKKESKIRPFRFSLDSRKIAPMPVSLSSDDIEMAKQFKARPVPASIRKSVGEIKPPLSAATPETKITSLPPRLSTSSRLEKRRASIAASDKRAAELLEEKRKKDEARRKLEAERNRAAGHTPSGNSFSTYGTPTQPVPFNLQSEARGEYHKEIMHERLQYEEEQRRKSSNFKALSLPRPSQPFVPVRGQAELTEPQEFHLSTDERHAKHMQELQAKLKAEEERLAAEAKIQALPVPKSLYVENFFAIKPSEVGRPKIEGKAPEFQTEKQVEHRKAFDQSVKERMLEKEEQMRILQEQQRSQEELEIQELRRLPVSQGGFQVEAKPINSVFKDRRRSRSGSLSTLSTQGSLMHANGNASALKSFR